MSAVFDSKFVKVLKTFDSQALKSFESWLKSPWCNSNKNLITLLDKLKKYHPDFEHNKLTKEKLFKQVLPKGKFSNRRMNNLLSEGYQAAERFLIFQNLAANENLQQDLLTQELQARHLEDWFFKTAEQEIARLEAKQPKDWEDHLHLLRLHRRVYHHPTQQTRMQPGGQTIVEMGEQLEILYLLEKAAILNEKITRNRVLKDENHQIEAEIYKWQLLAEDLQHPSMALYKLRFQYSDSNNLEIYWKLRDLYLSCYQKLNEKEQKIHLISLLNDSILLVRSGKIEITESLPLYKIGLETEILLYDGILSYNVYATIVAIGNTNKDFDFTSHFIERYAKKLQPDAQVDAYNWALSHTYYRQGQFQKSIDLLQAYEFKFFHFLLLSKVLTVQVYFDFLLRDGSYELYLFSYFNSFEKWINREKFRSQFYKKSYSRFVQLARTLANHFVDVNLNLEEVNKVLMDESNVQAIKWLNVKKDEIIKIKSRRSFQN